MEEMKMETNLIKVGDLYWEDEDVCIDGKDIFTYDEAISIAKEHGMRLPTSAEYGEIFSSYTVYYCDWVAEFPTLGLNFYYGLECRYWTSDNTNLGYNYLFLSNDDAAILFTTDKEKKHKVRLVKDVVSSIDDEFVSWKDKRCEFAGRAMQALITSKPIAAGMDWVTSTAVEYADMLIEKLKEDKS